MTVLRVSEVFGPTIQGEGPSAGRQAAFVRLALCNLACTWCDTPYTWDWDRYSQADEIVERDPVDVARQLYGMGTGLVVLTGGEPMMQQRQSLPMLRWLRQRRLDVEVETNGTIPPIPAYDTYVTAYNVSPKVTADSGNPERRAYRPQAVETLRDTGKARWKFVCRNIDDVDIACTFADAHGIPRADVWVMPEGVDAETLLHHTTAIADAAVEAGVNVTSRLHVLAWGDRRGV